MKRATQRRYSVCALVMLVALSAASWRWWSSEELTEQQLAGPAVRSTEGVRGEELPQPSDAVVSVDLPLHTGIEGPKPVTADLIDELNRADNYRVFLQTLLQSGAPGARLYALTVVLICERSRENAAVLAQPGTSREQDAAKQLLASRCGSFSSQELGSDYTYSLMKDRRLGNDPLGSLLNDLGRANQKDNLDQRMALVAKILETQDPILLERASLLKVNSDGSVRFDGENLTQPNSPLILALALQAANCVTKLDCGSRNQDVVANCALADQCFSDRKAQNREQVSRLYGEDGLRLYEQAVTKIESAISNRDPNIFR